MDTEHRWRSRRPKPEECYSSLTFSLQTLLARHEAYMASAERDRAELTARIEQLEHDYAELEVRNKIAVDENQSLRDELETLNDTVKDADTKIELLEAALRDSQREAQRLEGAAERAANLERQIALLEEEQLSLQNTLVSTQEEARSAMHRWKQAERGIIDLQEQLERMEKEARQERERHVEVIGRMERQRAMEKELDTAAGRLKGAAAVRSMTDSRNGRNVVSHFVRDLLQDNANLQLGIAELREMLVNSNDEIQMLREQLLSHQPILNHENSSVTTLRAELEQKEPPAPDPPRVQQELHIHHHYHVTHKPDSKRTKKKRHALTTGMFTPPGTAANSQSVAQTSRWQVSRGLGTALVPHLSKESTTAVPMTPTGRWSLVAETPSDFAPSSAPSSPQSIKRASMFDRGVTELSSPASPTTSIDPTSPLWRSTHRKQTSEISTRSISATLFPHPTKEPQQPQLQPYANCPTTTQSYNPPNHLNNLVLNEGFASTLSRAPYTTYDMPDHTQTVVDPPGNTTVHSSSTVEIEPDDTQRQASSYNPASQTTEEQFDQILAQRPRRRELRRVISHESIMSLSNGLDIHTLKARPSQLTLQPLGLTAAGTNVSAVTARPTISRAGGDAKRGSVYLRDVGKQALPRQRGPASAAARWGSRVVSGPLPQRPSAERNPSRQISNSTLGKLVNWRPWGQPSTSQTQDQAQTPSRPESQVPLLSSPESEDGTPGPTTPTLPAGIGTHPAALLFGLGGSPLTPTTGAMPSSPQSVTSSNASTGGSGVAFKSRAPGINQAGAIPGFAEYMAKHKRRGPPSKVSLRSDEHIAALDGIEEAMRETLDGG